MELIKLVLKKKNSKDENMNENSNNGENIIDEIKNKINNTIENINIIEDEDKEKSKDFLLK